MFKCNDEGGKKMIEMIVVSAVFGLIWFYSMLEAFDLD